MIKSFVIGMVLAAAAMTGCGVKQDSQQEKAEMQQMEAAAVNEAEDTEEDSMKKEIRKMNVQVNGASFTATLEDNAAVKELVAMMQKEPVTISMSDYSGFEKVGALGTSLTTSNRQTTTRSGDIVLYAGSQIVVFYGSNSWSYTKLGKIDDLTGWEEALGNGDVEITFSVE